MITDHALAANYWGGGQSKVLRKSTVTMKFILPSALVIMIVLGGGATLMIGQQKAAAMKEVREQAKLINSQIGVVRAYIADRYVNPVNNSNLKESIEVPVPATAVIETSKKLAESGYFEARLISSDPPQHGPRRGRHGGLPQVPPGLQAG